MYLYISISLLAIRPGKTIMDGIKEEMAKKDFEAFIQLSGEASDEFDEKMREIVALYTSWMKRDIARLRDHYESKKVPQDDRSKA